MWGLDDEKGIQYKDEDDPGFLKELQYDLDPLRESYFSSTVSHSTSYP
jgi:hypothetical protein